MRRVLTGLLLLLAVAIVILFLTAGFWTNWLWFGSLGFQSVLWTRYVANGILFAVAAVASALFFGLNVRFMARQLHGVPVVVQGQALVLAPRLVGVAVVLGSLAVGFIMGSAAAGEWPTVLAFLNRTPFGVTEPVFGLDASFYVFTLPLLEAARSWLLGLLILTLLAVGALGFLLYGQALTQRARAFPPTLRGHLSLLGALFLALVSFSYWLGNYSLLFSTRGVVFGASRADLYAQRPANYILFGLSLLAALLLGWNAAARRVRPLVSVLAVWAVAAVVVGLAFPAAYENFVVKPSQLQQERPYIANNIRLTSQAYNLSTVRSGVLAGDAPIDPAVLSANAASVANIRLWDYRPLLTTYQQIQRIKQYYEFSDVDIDRYQLNGVSTQVMLSARELDATQLPSKTWINRHLVYTHGYGVVVSPVNKVTPQGLPDLLVQDLPPSAKPPFELVRPEIYFGEKTADYVIVNTSEREFDRPGKTGEATEIYTRYSGQAGVPIGGVLNKLLFATSFGDVNILLSRSLTGGSRILYNRDIQGRVQRIAPFLRLDRDPYIVVLNGRLVWVQDAYTATDRFPYATPAPGRDFNYLRNSVKITVDAYTGEVRFYVVDEQDPLIRTYQKIYPGLFMPVSSAPPGLAEHFRYPVDLFEVQADIYATYHMTEPQVFYNREDQWAVAKETYNNSVQRMEAYYVSMQLPGAAQPEFALILPFTPAGQNRSNMVSWMVARSDPGNYGKLEVFQFPQGKFVFGPQQIEARINQEPDISAQLTLWGQSGSQVIRGNLLVIPLGDAVLYVQPLYIQASNAPLPELKRIIVASNQGVVMSDTLEAGLSALAQGRKGIVIATPGQVPAAATPATGAPSGQSADLSAQALDRFAKAQEALKRGDWATYGQELAEVERILRQMAGR